MRTLTALLCCLFTLLAHATTEVAGIRFQDSATIGEHTLALNGAGLRTKFFFKIYAVGLYLPSRATTAAAALEDTGAKRIDLTLLRDLSARKFVDALDAGLEKNLSATEMAALKPRITQFTQTLLALGEAHEGTRIQIDYTPTRGTQLVVAGQDAGAPIAGAEFFDALLRVWIGAHPAQDDLKARLLGR
ncbi:hypothetical protein G3580_15710 [Nitrogeniibacter mangrovi]|uniref:Chalcone isomerase domain-containing protein n=1 Tax=Nitrogeniibacter mangrovi TaxID=2016596 RepID=A0A6C1B9C2_9RHOO|nr:chalcone isomerase family protein [Nitrogeniibacter mangrovi]QID18940.1 hypothetical protein G3580_15710 [Nitrogeniibacter mangrovi]